LFSTIQKITFFFYERDLIKLFFKINKKSLPWTDDAAACAADTVAFFALTVFVAMTSAAADAFVSAVVNNSLACTNFKQEYWENISEYPNLERYEHLQQHHVLSVQ
jgi:hypothetical protein